LRDELGDLLARAFDRDPLRLRVRSPFTGDRVAAEGHDETLTHAREAIPSWNVSAARGVR
jgi:hypothetical protein